MLVLSNILCFGILAAVSTYVAMTGGSSSTLPTAGAIAAQTVADPVPQGPSYEKDIKPILAEYCFQCHNKDKQKAGLALDGFDGLDSVTKQRKTWELVLKMMQMREMPPEEKPQPSEEQWLRVTDWIRNALDSYDCDGPVSPGRVTLRRLNRVEYRNTVRDLVGIDYEPTDEFPGDDVGYGYDNIGDVLSVSPLLMEKYLAAAEDITARVFEGHQPTLASRKGGQRIDNDRLKANNGSRQDEGFGLSSEGDVYFEYKVDEAGDYILRVKASGERGGGEWPNLALRVDNDTIANFNVDARRGDGKWFEHKVALKKGKRRIAGAFTNDFYNPNHPDRNERDRNLYVEGFSIEGPMRVQQPGANENIPDEEKSPYDRIMIARPGKGEKDEQGNVTGAKSVDQAAREVIEPFATRAFRRPVTDEEMVRLIDFVNLAIEQDDSFDSGIQIAMQAVLVSPHFLFRIENDQQPDDPKHPEAGYTLTDLELATRLSYFIFSSMPDRELFDLALRNELTKGDNLQKQVRRMLASPRARALVDNFGGQWLQTRNLATVSPDPNRFDWDDALRQAMEAETLLLFQSIMRDDASVLRFLDADYTFVNKRLAEHYGFNDLATPPQNDGEFVKVSLKGTPRRGVLMHGSVLTITSDPNRTSPVKRGAWVLEQVLGTPPPPAPPNVPPLEEEDGGEPLQGSLRQRFEQHRADPTCMSCHERMDPIGFAFEHFDAVGRWRDTDNGVPVDPAGQLHDGRAFKDAGELIEHFKADKDLFIRNLTEQMLTYALGRGIEYYDKCAVDTIVRDVADKDYRFSELVLAIVRSDPFRKRAGKDFGQ